MKPTIPQLAQRYGVSPRTVLRYKALGIDVKDIAAVADHLATSPRPRLRTLEAVAALIANQEEMPCPKPTTN